MTFVFRYSPLFLVLALLGCKTATENCSTISPKLIEPIAFDGYTVSQIDSPKAARYLMTQKIASWGEYEAVLNINTNNPNAAKHDGFDFLRYEDGRVVRTETIQQYIEACATQRWNRPDQQNLAYAATTCDMNAEMWVEGIKDKLEFMSQAQPSIHSYLKDRYLKDLPVTILRCSLNACDSETSDRYEKILKTEAESGKTLNDYTKTWAPLHLTHWEDDVTLRFKDATMEIDYRIKELARGDVNGDGFEDALIEIGWHTEGTLGGSFTQTVTRTVPGSAVKFVEEGKTNPKADN